MQQYKRKFLISLTTCEKNRYVNFNDYTSFESHAETCHRVLGLCRGLIESGLVAEVFASPRHP